jgi:serine protease Do
MTVTLSSRFFDSFLIVTGPGDFLQKDDDSSGNRNAELSFTVPEQGTYNIIATSYSQERTGPYRIEVGTSGAD